MAGEKYNDHGTGIPRHEVESLARCFLPAIQQFFESDEGKREYAQWQEEQKDLKRKNKSA